MSDQQISHRISLPSHTDLLVALAARVGEEDARRQVPVLLRGTLAEGVDGAAEVREARIGSPDPLTHVMLRVRTASESGSNQQRRSSKIRESTSSDLPAC